MRNVVISVFSVLVLGSLLIGCAKKIQTKPEPLVLPEYNEQVDAPSYYDYWIECEADLDDCAAICEECCGSY